MATYQGHNEDSSGNLLLSIGNGMTATVELTNKASQAYTKGSYLFFNNRLCKAASAIASGATLTIGGNLTQTSLGAEITSHLRSSDGKEFYFDVKNGKYGYYPSASKTASEFVPFGGTVSVKEYIIHLGNTNRLIKSNGTVLTGDDITGNYLVSSYSGSYTFKAVQACKVLLIYNTGSAISTTTNNYSANQTITTASIGGTTWPVIAALN